MTRCRSKYDIESVLAMYAANTTYSEMAKHLGVSRGAVSAMIADMRKRFNLPYRREKAAFKTITEAPHANPLVRKLIALMNEQKVSWYRLSELTKISRETFRTWRTTHNPRVDLLIACFNVLGYTLVVVPIEDAKTV